MSDFVHLHAHSTHSIDAINNPKDLMQAAVNNDQEALAFTDHGEMSGAVDIISTAKSFENFKPIIGCELYVHYAGEEENATTHLTALADGQVGYNNLVRILNLGVHRSIQLGKHYRTHPTTIQDLLDNSEGVYLLTGCPKSLLQYKTTSDAGAIAELLKLKTKYDGRIFAEAMLSSDDENMIGSTTARAIMLSETCNIPLVITNDVHYAEKYQQPAHKFHVANRMGFTYPDDELYLKSSLEMKRSILSSSLDIKDKKRLLDAMLVSVEIANKLTAVSFTGNPQLPFINDSENLFRNAVWDGYQRLCILRGSDYPELKKRIEAEIQVIVDKGFPTYFLITQDMIEYAKKNNHKVGAGRGSVAGSAVAYVLGITNVDPVEYDLIFERFLNPERKAMPDIDNDFSDTGRKAVVDYLADKYKAVPIGTQAYYSHKILIHDIARYLRIPDDLKELLLEDEEKKSDAWGKVQRAYPDFNVIYETLIDSSIRHQSKHAGGVLILPENLEYEIPLTIVDSTAVSSLSEGTHGQDLSVAGGVKFDVLGVKTLGMIQELENNTGVRPPKIGAHEWSDCFTLIEQNDVDGVFQLGGNAARQYAQKYLPKSISQIADVTALARTGAKDSGAADAFLNFRVNKPKVKAVEPLDSGNLVDISIGGESNAYYDHWFVATKDHGWVQIKDLDPAIHEIEFFVSS